jgi:hypothetical protein
VGTKEKARALLHRLGFLKLSSAAGALRTKTSRNINRATFQDLLFRYSDESTLGFVRLGDPRTRQLSSVRIPYARTGCR